MLGEVQQACGEQLQFGMRDDDGCSQSAHSGEETRVSWWSWIFSWKYGWYGWYG